MWFQVYSRNGECSISNPNQLDMRNIIILLALCLGSFSCSNPEIILLEEDLLGIWRSENTRINGLPASHFLQGNDFYSSILGLKEDNFYFLDYSSGNWYIEDNELHLSNRGVFEIENFRDSIMTLKVEIEASQLYWALEGIDQDDFITLQEDFRKD